MHDSSPFNQRSLGQHNSWVSRSLGARENPCFSAQIRPERTIGVWSPLGSSPCGCPCNPWSKAKNSSLPRPAARSDNLSHIGRSGHTAEVCHFGPHIVPHSQLYLGSSPLLTLSFGELSSIGFLLRLL